MLVVASGGGVVGGPREHSRCELTRRDRKVVEPTQMCFTLEQLYEYIYEVVHDKMCWLRASQ